jgi:hypothetical protein
MGDRPSGVLDMPPLGRVLDQDRVGVVDVYEDPLSDPRLGQGRDRAGSAGHGHVPHAPPGFLPDTGLDEIVIVMDGAVEQKHVDTVDPGE